MMKDTVSPDGKAREAFPVAYLRRFERSYSKMALLLVVISSLATINNFACALPNEIKVGTIFGPNEQHQELVFKTALNDINSDLNFKSIFVPRVENLSRDDSFDADRKACSLLKMGVVAILGPMGSAASQHVQAICDSLEVPHIEIRQDLNLRRVDLAINLYPPYDVLQRAYMDLIRAWNWTSFAIVYESSETMIRLQDMFKELQKSKTEKLRKWSIKLFQLQLDTKFRDLFWNVTKSGENNIILDVSRENLFECLKHAQQVGLMTDKQSYLITSLDLQTVDLDNFKYGRTKITGLQMIDRNSKALERVLGELNRHAATSSLEPILLSSSLPPAFSSAPFKKRTSYSLADISLQTALIYDAVTLLAGGIRELDRGESIEAKSLSCDSTGETLQYGSSIINYMRLSSFDGMTGRVSFDQSRRASFDQYGRRSGNNFQVISLNESGLQYIGKWEELANVSLQFDSAEFNRFYITEENTIDTLIVTTLKTAPYFMLKSTSNKQEGNDQYEGYAVDLIHELARIVGFKYEFREVLDGKRGNKECFNETIAQHKCNLKKECKPKKNPEECYCCYWNGMIKEVINGDADLAIVDLTITAEREEVVDFTLPFMNTGISIIFKKPVAEQTTLFSFLSPFSLYVWVYVLCAYSCVSMVLFIVGHISPYEWTNPFPCRQENYSVLQNSFSLLNSFWFTIGSLMQQGSDLAPKSMSTRAMAGIWYFFTLIMISSYTANLAAFLTVEKIEYPISSVNDLANQEKILYGCLAGGSTSNFFKDSADQMYKKVYEVMKKKHTLVDSTEAGKDWVEKGNYAFFMESTSIEYITERSCNLTQIGSLLDSKNYGIATRKPDPLSNKPPYRRPYRTEISKALLQLQESGMLHVIKNRWWKEKHGVGTCNEENKGGGVTQLTLANVGGVFVVLLGGMGFAFILALAESFLWMHKRKLNRDLMCEQMMADFKFALSCQSSTKPSHKMLPSKGVNG